MNDKAVTDANVNAVDIQSILEMIPHRYPLLLVDKVINIVSGESATGVKNVTFNEPQFQGHFPGHPIMPGVMIVEAMAQTACVLVAYTLGADARGKLVYFLSIDDCRFRKPVRPGDVMHLNVVRHRQRKNIWWFNGDVTVDGQTVAEAKIGAMIVDPEDTAPTAGQSK